MFQSVEMLIPRLISPLQTLAEFFFYTNIKVQISVPIIYLYPRGKPNFLSIFWYLCTHLWMGCYITYESVVERSTFSIPSTAKWWHDCWNENHPVCDLKYLAFEVKLKEEESRLWYFSFSAWYTQDRNVFQHSLQKMAFLPLRGKIFTSKILKFTVLNVERNNYNESPRHQYICNQSYLWRKNWDKWQSESCARQEEELGVRELRSSE